MIKPIIDTSEDVSDASRESGERISRQAEERTRQVQLDVSRGIALNAARSARIAGDRERARRMDFCRAL